MKTMIRFLSLAALALAFTLPAYAQDTAAAPAAQNPCEEQARTDMYTDYYNSKKGDAAAQKHAYEVGTQYLQKYSACNDKYNESVKKYVDAYKKAQRDFEFTKAISEKRWVDATALGKDILADNPADVKTTTLTAWAAYNAAIPPVNNTALSGDAITQAQRAIQLFEAGKTADNYVLFTSKDDAQSYMNYILGALNLKSNPAEASKYLVKLAQANGAAKQEPSTYAYLAFAYEKEYAKLYDEYKAKYPVESPESKVALANINLVVDRIADAYARAVALGNKDPRKAEWMKTLTELYKSRHGDSEAGLNEMIASSTTKPLLITTPVTEPPVETPATTNGGDGATGTKPPMTTMPATTASPTMAQPMTTQPKPAQPTTSATPKPMPMTKKPPVKRQHG